MRLKILPKKRVNNVNHFRNYVTPFSVGWLIFVRINYLIDIKKNLTF